MRQLAASTGAQRSVASSALLDRIEAGIPPVILDVRSRREFERGHVPGAIHLPFHTVPKRRGDIPAAGDDMVVVYCGHGPRAWMAGMALRWLGFSRVAYLEGHMRGWRRAGFREEPAGPVRN